MTDSRYASFTTLKVAVEGRVVTATVDNPPLNMITLGLLDDLDRFTREAAEDPDTVVVVIKSADPDIFITHNEFANLYKLQPQELPKSADEVELNRMHHICERLRTMDKVTIAQVEGRAAGGGAAIVMACDMKFGALGKAVFNTMSVPLGAVPGGGASQYMPRLIGRSRALELILGGLDLDAATAERWGYLNRALAPEDIDAFVASTAARIASCPPDAVRLTKEAVTMSDGPIEQGLREENYRFRLLMASEESLTAIRTFLEVGGETRDGETRMEALLGDVLAHEN
ncbi:enoyl-CoA hydratase/isomerase family protein [Rhodococcus sp. NPDC127530]|uniref:enoyl-CoA hydratase/isomerase family protein n=1 Tax=unclassified Rhodococcus (in: high G+C Gram-positive bacteria) TaxID=192944 RepID=UPI003644C122